MRSIPRLTSSTLTLAVTRNQTLGQAQLCGSLCGPLLTETCSVCGCWHGLYRLAEVHFKAVTPLQLSDRLQEALEQCRAAMGLLGSRKEEVRGLIFGGPLHSCVLAFAAVACFDETWSCCTDSCACCRVLHACGAPTRCIAPGANHSWRSVFVLTYSCAH